MPVIGFLSSGSPTNFAALLAAFHRGLSQTGYVEGRNVSIEYRWAEGQYDRVPEMANDLVLRQVAIIVTSGGPVTALAAKAATKTIPVVFTSGGGDPIQTGLVASFNRPGSNVTGVSLFTSLMVAKRLELLRDIVPTGATIAVLLNPASPTAEIQSKDLQGAVSIVGQQTHVLRASTEQDLDTAFATMAQIRAGALLVTADPFFYIRLDQIVAQAARYAIPAIYEEREFAAAGGLMSYGTSLGDAYHIVGSYTGRILKGEKPADLPVQRA
jgi:putative tryptophan/tyrosine transport system substrate-binding protein